MVFEKTTLSIKKNHTNPEMENEDKVFQGAYK